MLGLLWNEESPGCDRANHLKLKNRTEMCGNHNTINHNTELLGCFFTSLFRAWMQWKQEQKAVWYNSMQLYMLDMKSNLSNELVIQPTRKLYFLSFYMLCFSSQREIVLQIRLIIATSYLDPPLSCFPGTVAFLKNPKNTLKMVFIYLLYLISHLLTGSVLPSTIHRASKTRL